MTDTKKVILCPACGNLMSKIYMPEEGLDLDFCNDGCGGIFFDSQELEKFDKPTDNAEEIINIANNTFFNPVNDKIDRICPACGINMVKEYIEKADITIDICNFCGGKFLDNGEFQKIRDLKKITTLLS